MFLKATQLLALLICYGQVRRPNEKIGSWGRVYANRDWVWFPIGGFIPSYNVGTRRRCDFGENFDSRIIFGIASKVTAEKLILMNIPSGPVHCSTTRSVVSAETALCLARTKLLALAMARRARSCPVEMRQRKRL